MRIFKEFFQYNLPASDGGENICQVYWKGDNENHGGILGLWTLGSF